MDNVNLWEWSCSPWVEFVDVKANTSHVLAWLSLARGQSRNQDTTWDNIFISFEIWNSQHCGYLFNFWSVLTIKIYFKTVHAFVSLA